MMGFNSSAPRSTSSSVRQASTIEREMMKRTAAKTLGACERVEESPLILHSSIKVRKIPRLSKGDISFDFLGRSDAEVEK